MSSRVHRSSAKLLIAQCKSLSDVVRVESDATPNSLALTEKRNSGHVRYDGERRGPVGKRCTQHFAVQGGSEQNYCHP